MRQDWTAPRLFVAREPLSLPEGAFPLVRNQTSDQGSPAAMTRDASPQPTPTAVTSVAAVRRLPVIFGAEVRLDFPVAPAETPEPTKSRFPEARRGETPPAIQGETRIMHCSTSPDTSGSRLRFPIGFGACRVRGSPCGHRLELDANDFTGPPKTHSWSPGACAARQNDGHSIDLITPAHERVPEPRRVFLLQAMRQTRCR